MLFFTIVPFTLTKERENDRVFYYFCNVMKRTLILITLLLMASITAVAQLKGDATTRGELREMVKPGNKVFMIFDDKTGDFDEKSEYIVEFLIQDARWKVAENLKEADFVLYVEGYSGRSQHSVTSKTYYMTPTVRRRNGTDVWTGETVYDWANLSNGFKAVKSVSWRLVRSLRKGLEKELGEDRILLSV